MILFNEQLIRISLRESRIRLLLSVVEQDGSSPRVPTFGKCCQLLYKTGRLGWFSR